MIDEHERAVALRYHPEKGELPEVTAKGRGAIAAKIKTIATERGIPVERDGDLVAVLDKLDVGNPIPTVAFAAVAEVLAQLYRANAATPAGALEHRP
jgi:type III secretion system FlhB-like substrate exporter